MNVGVFLLIAICAPPSTRCISYLVYHYSLFMQMRFYRQYHRTEKLPVKLRSIIKKTFASLRLCALALRFSFLDCEFRS